MSRYPIGLISSEGDIRMWRDIGKEVTIYSSFRSPEIGMNNQIIKGKIYIDRRYVYLCWDKYTARFSTIVDAPVKIRLQNNVFFKNDFFLTDETYNGFIKGYYQIIIDDKMNNVYFIYKKEQKGNKVVYTYPKSDFSYITNGKMDHDNVLGDGENHSTYACIIKGGIPSFATINGQPNFDGTAYASVKTFKQGPFVYFIHNDKHKVAVLDMKRCRIFRSNGVSECTHFGGSVARSKSSIRLGDRYAFYFDPDGTSYMTEIVQDEKGNKKESNPSNILNDKDYWVDFKAGDTIFK